MNPHSLERFFVYFPTKTLSSTPSDRGLEFEDLRLVAEDGPNLHAWYLPIPDSRVTLLIFHGNAGNMGDRVVWLEMLRAAGANILILDYRGYGRSEGSPQELGLYLDAMAAYRWWHQRWEKQGGTLVLLGESLGGAVAVELATRVPVAGLVLQSTFTSAGDMAKTMPPIGWLQPLIGVHYDSASRIAGIACPKLFIHGERDEIIPYRQGRKLFDLATEPKEFYSVPGAGHNDLPWVAGPEYVRRIKAFLARL